MCYNAECFSFFSVEASLFTMPVYVCVSPCVTMELSIVSANVLQCRFVFSFFSVET